MQKVSKQFAESGFVLSVVFSMKGIKMRYQVSGKQIDIGTALQQHVKREIDEVVSKYAERPTDAIVVFSKSGHEFVCEATVHLSTGLTAQARSHENEIYASFDNCAAKMEKQLRRYKRRLKDHHATRTTPVELSSASSYILVSEHGNEESEPENLQPIIIAEVETTIPKLSVGEAVMQMEISGKDFFVFKNDSNKLVSIVYHRDDGNIGWIEPK